MMNVEGQILKVLIYLVFPILFFVSCQDQQANSNSGKIDKIKNLAFFVGQDSGYITKKDILTYLASKALTDSSNTYWKNYKSADTIGKFYKTDPGNNFIFYSVAFKDSLPAEEHLIFEIDRKGKILKKERFYLGVGPYCLDGDFYGGFQKKGKYFYLTSCGTGTNYYASLLWFFDHPLSQEKLNYVIGGGYQGMGYPFYLTSTMDFEAGNLIMHYTMQRGVVNEEEEENDLGFKVTETEKFDIVYKRKENQWIPTDSAKFKKLEGVVL